MSRPVACRGQARRIVYAVTPAGSPGLDFVNGLDARNKAKVVKLFQMLGDRGEIHNKEHFKPIEGTKFCEFKSHQIRLPCYRDGLFWIITHGFIKKSDKIAREEIHRAERIRDEDKARQAGIHKVHKEGR